MLSLLVVLQINYIYKTSD